VRGRWLRRDMAGDLPSSSPLPRQGEGEGGTGGRAAQHLARDPRCSGGGLLQERLRRCDLMFLVTAPSMWRPHTLAPVSIPSLPSLARVRPPGPTPPRNPSTPACGLPHRAGQVAVSVHLGMNSVLCCSRTCRYVCMYVEWRPTSNAAAWRKGGNTAWCLSAGAASAIIPERLRGRYWAH